MKIIQPGPERYFNEDQKADVEAIFEAILPGRPNSPGARDAQAAEYLSALLGMGDDAYYEIAGWKRDYETALPALNAASAQRYDGRSLAQLSTAEVSEMLWALSESALDSMPAGLDQKRLFAILRSHCIEGCFADPRWRGNRDGVMWRWFGYLSEAQDFERNGSSGGSKAVTS